MIHRPLSLGASGARLESLRTLVLAAAMVDQKREGTRMLFDH